MNPRRKRWNVCACYKRQCADEQRKKWLPLAYKIQIIGRYAQAELGRGSNVQDLETTATCGRNSDEFIIHSPHIDFKQSDGGLGKA
ncbi:peroxisomal acyl-coenzyme A oxidase 1-like [Nymphaea colorata]|nr:peroxisomal acyl-coenzyme A oxidase 1-like [Nymphaea colorata]